jgi:hypothetical protein
MDRAPQSLEETLTAMADRVAFPPEPQLVSAVGSRLRVAAGPRARTPWLRLAAAALALGLAATGVLFFSPGARRAVAGWLGLPGIRITTSPSGTPPPPGRALDLGKKTRLAQAEARLGAPVRLPFGPLGPPDAVYVDRTDPIVWLLYEPSPGLPALDGHDVGLLVTELRARGLDELFYKKLLGAGAEVRNVAVNGNPGFWIHGQPHIIQYRYSLGVRQEPGRVSGNSLIWIDNGITYRLELDSGLAEAETIARSLK